MELSIFTAPGWLLGRPGVPPGRHTMANTGRLPNFHIGKLPVYGDLVLAPMDGYTDWPMRLICRELGSAMSYTEFVNVDEVAFAHKERNSVRQKLEFQEEERPVAFQIYGSDEERLVSIAQRLEILGPDIIDINLGCSIRKIAERGAGAGMLKDPAAIGRLFARLTDVLELPVTAKIRLGWDGKTRNYLEVARALEDGGCRLIAVHARTRDQAMGGAADWDAIAEIKNAVRIPVLGNGNVRTVADIEAMRKQTGCDGVMIGRGAIGHPWIFSRIDKDVVPLEDRVAMASRHLRLMVGVYGEKQGCLIFRKHAVRYVHHLISVGKLRSRLSMCSSVAEYERMFAHALAEPEDAPESGENKIL
jgi:tRNA-dihydrouridine synthase B